jgi:hypothetical protein
MSVGCVGFLNRTSHVCVQHSERAGRSYGPSRTNPYPNCADRWRGYSTRCAYRASVALSAPALARFSERSDPRARTAEY